jgi:hypothetical protein
MGNLGITEMVMILASLLFWGGGAVAVILGVVAFFRTEKLVKKVADLESKLHAVPPTPDIRA